MTPPPSASRATGTALRFLVAALMLGAIASALRFRSTRPDVEEMDRPEAAERCEPVAACGPQILQDIPGAPTVAYAAACGAGAYLCDGLVAWKRPLRALRWSDGATHVRVLVPWPATADADQGIRQQRGAVRGLHAWDGSPLDVLVDAGPKPREDGAVSDDRPRSVVGRDYRPPPRPVVGSTGLIRDPGNPSDFTIQWNVTPRSEERAEAYTTWGQDGSHGGYGTKVTSVFIAMMTEWPGGRPLSDREVEAAAAHAMGHVLGLPHSSSATDVMFPGNTVSVPSANDRAALAALYALPNGAHIAAADR